MSLRKLIDRNIFISDFARRISCYSYNKKIQRFIEEISLVDSISDYSGFKKILNRLPPQAFGSTYSIKRAYAENTLYGYAYNVMKYAGLENEDILYFPLLEHGIDLSEEFYAPRYVSGRNYIFQGNNKIDVWTKKLGQKGYAIGPFIHYSESYYSDKQIEEIKRKNGKTLLVFLPHSDEYGGEDFLMDGFTKELFEIAKGYDSIIASVFWIDTTDKYVDYLQNQGVTLVSSGFKLDNNFVSRMKTIIQMADTVVFPIMTTSIGYAYYLGKKVICLSSERNNESINTEDQEFVSAENNRYVSKFCKIFNEKADRKSKEADELIDHYWGTSLIRNPDYIRNIYFTNKKEIKKKVGF